MEGGIKLGDFFHENFLVWKTADAAAGTAVKGPTNLDETSRCLCQVFMTSYKVQSKAICC